MADTTEVRVNGKVAGRKAYPKNVKKYNTSSYRALNILRRGPATLEQIARVSNHRGGVGNPGYSTLMQLRKRGHVIQNLGQKTYRLVKDAEKDDKRSWEAQVPANVLVRKTDGTPPTEKTEQELAQSTEVDDERTVEVSPGVHFNNGDFSAVRQIVNILRKYSNGDNEAVQAFRTNKHAKRMLARLEWKAMGLEYGFFDNETKGGEEE